MQQVLYKGLETLPVTMAPPYRGLHLVKDDFIYDKMGNKWYNYQFDKPEGMSRVFGPLTRYKFYFAENNQELEFDNPNKMAWDYVSKSIMNASRTLILTLCGAIWLMYSQEQVAYLLKSGNFTIH